jgi:protein-tyrosine sulfotransferase
LHGSVSVFTHRLSFAPPELRAPDTVEVSRVGGITGNPIFVGGVPRSGTTLLRVILDSHPRIFCGTELRVIPSLAQLWRNAWESAARPLKEGYGIEAEDFRSIFHDLILSFLTPAWQASGKARLAEKTPSNFLAFNELRLLFPESPLIHIIRDGRDVVTSRVERDLDAEPDTDLVAIAGLRARLWSDAMALRARLITDPRFASHYFELRYEDLVREPRRELTRLFAFLGEEFDERVLSFYTVERNVDGTEEWSAEAVRRPIFQESIGRFRHDLAPEALEAVMENAGEALRTLGYLENEP